MPDVAINVEKCILCGNCLRICPFGVYEMVENVLTAVNISQCIACRACEAACPVEAIIINE